MKKFKFTQDIAGSNNGYTITNYTKGQVITEKEISEYLLKAWTKMNILKQVKGEADADVDKTQEDVDNTPEAEEENADKTEETGETDVDNSEQDVDNAEELSETGDADLDAFLNGETDELPKGTTEITTEEALALQLEELLKVEPKEIDRIKEIGIALGIANMEQCKNADTITRKAQEYLASIK